MLRDPFCIVAPKVLMWLQKLCSITLRCSLVKLSGGTLARRARAGRAPGIFCDLCPTGGLLRLICWATLYGFAPWPPGHQQMF